MHQISISDEVKNKLIELCLIDGLSEDFVLRRLLCCSQNNIKDNKEDFVDTTYGIRFAKGFMIFRTYKGQPYSARVSNKCWLLDGKNRGKKAFYSLNKLSQAVIEGNENAWKFWHFINLEGKTQCISELRDPILVKRYQRSKNPRKSEIKSIDNVTKQTSNRGLSLAQYSINKKFPPPLLPAIIPTKTPEIIKVKKPWECD
jgi:hypothetical protein